MKLTKKQRHDAYVKAYNSIASQEEVYICVALLSASAKVERAYWKSDLLLSYFTLWLFPELALFKPNKRDLAGGWWTTSKSNRARLNALGLMIAMTE